MPDSWGIFSKSYSGGHTSLLSPWGGSPCGPGKREKDLQPSLTSQGQMQLWVQTPGSLAAPGSCPLFSGERTFRLQDGGQKPWARQSQMGKEPQGTRVAAAAEGQSST